MVSNSQPVAAEKSSFRYLLAEATPTRSPVTRRRAGCPGTAEDCVSSFSSLSSSCPPLESRRDDPGDVHFHLNASPTATVAPGPEHVLTASAASAADSTDVAVCVGDGNCESSSTCLRPANTERSEKRRDGVSILQGIVSDTRDLKRDIRDRTGGSLACCGSEKMKLAPALRKSIVGVSTKCCKCSAAGTCANCSCAKNGCKCMNCTPGGKGVCKNGGNRLPFTTMVSGETGGPDHDHETPETSDASHSSQPAFCAVNEGCVDVADCVDSLDCQNATDNATRKTDGIISPDINTFGLISSSSGSPADSFYVHIASAYEQVVHWRRNVFNVPYGATGGAFVDELAGLIRSFAEGTPLRQIAWKAVCVACHLLLQRPNTSGTAQTFSKHLQRRLSLWKSRCIPQLLDEALCIQNHLPSRNRKRRKPEISDTVFSNLVYAGKIQSAIRYVSEKSSSGVLGMDDRCLGGNQTVRDILLEKHPAPSTPPAEALLPGEPLSINPILFERLTPELIKEVGRRTQGSAGPSGLDADAWTRMLTCFKQSSNRLCAALAASAYCLCTADLTNTDLSAFTAARLIPLDKNPGVRPIAVGEVFRRIICKSVMRVIERDILLATAPLQLCVGVPSACEAAVHAMSTLFSRPSIQGILLVDATNAFNVLNRTAALHNVSRCCPALAKIVTNTYNKPVRLFVSGGSEILSQEGTCQGDPLAMAIYAVATTPLIKKLGNACQSITQCWYADDNGAGDDLVSLRKYWDKLIEIGPGYGYHSNPSKTVLLTKPEHQQEALRLFSDTGVMIRSDGCRYLGGALGGQDFCHSFMSSLVDKWCAQLGTLAEMAQTQPQAAYAAFTKGLSTRWKYHIRSTQCPPDTFRVLDDIINTSLLPAFIGHELNDDDPERTLISLPARLGGMAIPIIHKTSFEEYSTSVQVTHPVVNLITTSSIETDCVEYGHPDQVLNAVSACRDQVRQERAGRHSQLTELARSLKDHVSGHQQFLLDTASQKGVSSWLTADPSRDRGSALNKSDFRDAVCLRYGLQLDGLPTSCVCGEDMTVDHALTCPSGGYPTARHNEVRDLLANVMKDVLQDVEVEPKLLPYQGEDLEGKTANRANEARLDIRAKGFWTRQQEAFFDIRVTHPKANLLSSSQVLSQLRSHESEKKRQYAERVNCIDRGSFTPLVFATNGMMGRECLHFLKSLVAMIVEKNIDLTYAKVMNLLRCKLAFVLMRWNITCLRGCRAAYFRSRGNTFLTECRMMASS